MRKHVIAAVTVAALVAAAIGAPQRAAAASAPKVVLIVGATGSQTSSYRSNADSAAATFAKYTSNIVKVYSPNATWAAVSAAAQGANFVVYLGHGSGWPNPYAPGYHQPNADNGMGLNSSAGAGDSNTKYYGENYMATLGLAPSALVLLWHLCYASGDNEWGTGLPTLSTAKQRVDGYASGFIRAGASAVIAEGVGDIRPYIDSIFSGTNPTLDYTWKHAPNFHNHLTSWNSTHVDSGVDLYLGRGSVSQIDPDLDHPAGDGDYYYRSMVGRPQTTANDILGGAAPASNPNVERWAGQDRYEADATIVGKAFTGPVPVAFIATGADFADALTGAAAAAKLGAPMLLVDTNSIPAPIAAQLAVLKPAKIYILGGAASVSTGVETALHQYSQDVQRLGGSDRFDTARIVATTFFASGVPTAFVALGLNFPDALAGAAVAGKLGAPVLLVNTSSIPPATDAALKALKPGRIVVLGGEVVVSAGVAGALGGYTTGGVARWSGNDRFETGVAVATNVYKDPGVPYVFVATGLTFPDALAGAPVSGRFGGPVLLVSPDSIPPSVVSALQALQPKKIVILGGTVAVNSSVQMQLGAFVPPA